MAFIEIRTPQKFLNPEGLIQLPDLNSDMLVDLNADTLTGSEGSPVSQWEAGGELGAVLDTAISYEPANNLPHLEVGGANGHNCVKFTGTNSIATTDRDIVIAESGAPVTVAFVMRDDSATSTGRILSGYNHIPNFRNIQMTGNKVAVQGSTEAQGSVRAVLPSEAPLGVWGAYVARIGNGKLRITSSFGEQAETTADAGALSGVILGANMGGTSPLVGSIARLQIFGREMTDQEVGMLLRSMGATYGIPVIEA